MNEHVDHVWAAIHYALPGLKKTYGALLPRWLSDWELRNTPEYAGPHKHNKDWHVQRLMEYIMKRSEEKEYRTFIGEKSDKSNRHEKLATAKKLVNILNNYDDKLTAEDKKALSDGRLQDIFLDLVNDGYLTPPTLSRSNTPQNNK